MIRRLSLPILVLLALSACAPSRHRAYSHGPRDGSVMLCVENLSEAVGTIRVWVDDFRTHTVSSGKRVCRTIRETSAGSTLRAESFGGGIRGPVQYASFLNTSDVDCWDWILRDSAASEARLVPCSFTKRED